MFWVNMEVVGRIFLFFEKLAAVINNFFPTLASLRNVQQNILNTADKICTGPAATYLQ